MRSVVAIALIACSFAATALAAGERAVFKDSVEIKFNAEHFALIRAQVLKALAAEPGSDVLSWKNEATGSSGSVEPLEREVWSDLPCRQLRIVNTHLQRSAQGVYRFCEKPAGRWKLARPVVGKR